MLKSFVLLTNAKKELPKEILRNAKEKHINMSAMRKKITATKDILDFSDDHAGHASCLSKLE
jgi:hypothetical protein